MNTAPVYKLYNANSGYSIWLIQYDKMWKLCRRKMFEFRSYKRKRTQLVLIQWITFVFFFIDHSVVSQRSTSCWCLVTYFEQSLKVGDIWKASSPSITIDGFTDTGDPQRFCLGPLYNLDRTQSAEIARRNIGKKKTKHPII